jgi:hypothetical protein
MKHFWSSVLAAGVLSMVAFSQTASTSGSASANTSVSPGQASAGVNANQSTQASGVSTITGAAGDAKISHDGKAGHEASVGSQADSAASAGGAANASALLTQGSTLHTELTKPVDCKKAKPGDEVTAKVTEDVKSNGKVVVHKGSKVVGHVTEVQARSKEHADSRLGITFDKLVMSGGQEMAFTGVIQAIAPPVSAMASSSLEQSSDLAASGGRMPSGGEARPTGTLGGVAGGALSTVGSTAGAATNTVGSVGTNAGGAVGGVTSGLSARGTLTSASSGVVGLQGLALSNASSANAQGSLITSPTQNVKLDSGTQVLLRAAGSAQ